MYKWQMVFRPNQVFHDLVVVINHHLFSDIGGVPTHLSGGAPSKKTTPIQKYVFIQLLFEGTGKHQGEYCSDPFVMGGISNDFRDSHPRCAREILPGSSF